MSKQRASFLSLPILLPHFPFSYLSFARSFPSYSSPTTWISLFLTDEGGGGGGRGGGLNSVRHTVCTVLYCTTYCVPHPSVGPDSLTYTLYRVLIYSYCSTTDYPMPPLRPLLLSIMRRPRLPYILTILILLARARNRGPSHLERSSPPPPPLTLTSILSQSSTCYRRGTTLNAIEHGFPLR